jgi:hypothetical protein
MQQTDPQNRCSYLSSKHRWHHLRVINGLVNWNGHRWICQIPSSSGMLEGDLKKSSSLQEVGAVKESSESQFVSVRKSATVCRMICHIPCLPSLCGMRDLDTLCFAFLLFCTVVTLPIEAALCGPPAPPASTL